MVRLHNETAQRHGAICASLEAKRRELEALQQHAEGGGAGAGAATTVLTVTAAEGAPIAANLATFGPRQVALEGAWCGCGAAAERLRSGVGAAALGWQGPDRRQSSVCLLP